jgi:hypothetical protein
MIGVKCLVRISMIGKNDNKRSAGEISDSQIPICHPTDSPVTKIQFFYQITKILKIFYLYYFPFPYDGRKDS